MTLSPAGGLYNAGAGGGGETAAPGQARRLGPARPLRHAGRGGRRWTLPRLQLHRPPGGALRNPAGNTVRPPGGAPPNTSGNTVRLSGGALRNPAGNTVRPPGGALRSPAGNTVRPPGGASSIPQVTPSVLREVPFAILQVTPSVLREVPFVILQVVLKIWYVDLLAIRFIQVTYKQERIQGGHKGRPLPPSGKIRKNK